MTKSDILEAFAATEANFRALQESVDIVANAAEKMTELVKSGGKAIFCGNG